MFPVSFPDSVVWECHLTGRIVPKRSKLSLGRVRWEVKLWKADPIQWSEYEVRCSYVYTQPIAGHTQLCKEAPHIHERKLEVVC